MSKGTRSIRPSPALIVAFIALFVAMGGVGFAAIKLKPNSVKTKHIKAKAVTEPKIADGAVSTAKFASGAVAPNAAKLGGTSASDLQKACEPGAIKGSVKIDTTGLTAAYATVAGFNCEGGAVQVRRTGTGGYNVRFVGNPGAGTAVVTAGGTETSTGVFPGDPITAQVERNADGTIGGEQVFNVEIRSADSTGVETDDGGFLDDQEFTLLAF
jgi:hypothetical protein